MKDKYNDKQKAVLAQIDAYRAKKEQLKNAIAVIERHIMAIDITIRDARQALPLLADIPEEKPLVKAGRPKKELVTITQLDNIIQSIKQYGFTEEIKRQCKELGIKL